MSTDKIIGTCSIYSYWTGKRYPGEECNIDSDCISSFCCKDGICLGLKEGDICTGTQKCTIGLYSNKDSMKCTKQKKKEKHVKKDGIVKIVWDVMEEDVLN